MTSPSRLPRRVIQNFHLVWLDKNIDETNDDYRNSVTKLRQVVNTVNTFIDEDECINFITDIKETVFMVISEQHSQRIIPVVEYIPQVSYIYIFGENNVRYESWAKKCIKVKGAFISITSICEALKQVVEDWDGNSISICIIKPSEGISNQNLDELDPSFMYTQILKEILLTIEFEQVHFNEFITYCREKFFGNNAELKNVDLIEKEYRPNQSIRWYTSPYFLYSMLNKALRSMDVPLIVNMGFFIRDLHNNITALHIEQYSSKNYSHSFVVYRGQGLTPTELDHMQKTRGGLMSFNNFLSTSRDRYVSLAYAESNADNPDLIGVLFCIIIDPSIASFSFADVKNVSYFQEIEEILFSMHSVFRIGQIKQIDGNDRLWQVDLTSTGDNDPQLHALTERMREETGEGSTGWFRLGQLMIQVAQFDKAEELYKILLEQTTNEGEKEYIFHMLGFIKTNQGKYAEAVEFYEKSIKIKQKMLSPTHSDLAVSYTSIGAVYEKMGEYSKALSYQEKALGMYQNTVSSNHFTFSASSDNSDLTNVITDDCTRTISSFEKEAEILEKTLHKDDPLLATSYDHYGSACVKMGNNDKALLFYKRALEIRKSYLPFTHPSLAVSYENLGAVYQKMGDLSTAHTFYQRAFDIGERSLPASHPERQQYKKTVRNAEVSL